jgi:hypothetical protein
MNDEAKEVGRRRSVTFNGRNTTKRLGAEKSSASLWKKEKEKKRKKKGCQYC